LIEERGEEVFTEIDVISEAATDKWRNGQYTKAIHDANEICGSRYRKRKLCRYGPVVFGKGKQKTEDYARFAGKIVYADAAKGPDVLETPNGHFAKMMVEDDTLSKQGRKPASKRNDSEPWDEQALPAKPRKPKPFITGSTRDLEKMVSELARRVQTLEAEREEERLFFAKQSRRTASPA
jgi:hypothetical protein